MQPPSNPSDNDSKPAPGDTPERMNIDPADPDLVVDTASEPAVPLFPTTGPADSGPSAPSVPTTEVVDDLPNSGTPYYTLHPKLHVPIHSHGCDICTAFLSHQDPSHPSWAHVQEQFRIHSRAQFQLGVSRGLAFASERIATAEGIRRRAEENVARMTRQRDISRQSEAAVRDRIAELQSQLETIRAEHAALVRDHAHAEQALDRARAPSRPRSPVGDTSSIGSQRRRSPRPEGKKRKRSPPRSTAEATRRAPHHPTTAPTDESPSWTSVVRHELRGPLWDRWVPLTHEDVAFALSRAVSDPHASARVRTLALLAGDRAISDRSPVMRFLVQQYYARRDSLAAPAAVSPPASALPAIPARHSNGGGPGPGAPPHDWDDTPARQGSGRTRTVAPSPSNPAHSTANPQATAPHSRRSKPPSYDSPTEEWIEYIREDPKRCPQGVTMHNGSPSRRLLERHLEIRRNGPQGREQYQRSSRGHWVTRTTQLFSIRGLFGRVLHHRDIPVLGSVSTIHPYMGDTRNISLEDVARHFASNGYQPRSQAVREFEEYAVSRRNTTERRSPNETAEWESYPTLAGMHEQYPPIHAPAHYTGPPRNLYANMSLDLRATNDTPRSRTPEGPVLSSTTTGSMSPDFPAHYTPPTPHFVPIEDHIAGPLPPELSSWADDDFTVNNSLGSNVNNINPGSSAVDPAALPLPASRSVTPMDATD
ncbi:hypothetical protein FA95DRAFT_1613325 [Auriscalpium vulgare]|uniref:Uncharacterized protein n=1 Tax=Auriscalpium vulgare TaxID=40419 RepID=A0ACB8R3Q2_9AGAM|nr:hypothetical protein FA95DRAFT_1613325 [Auriscalpium vulgare]